jgi:HTH-type transcriptional regulator/antitoxin HigA
MISNDRQYKITRAELERLKDALRNFDDLERVREGIDPLIITAQRDSIQSQVSELEQQILAYEQLSSGRVRRLFPNSVTDIGQKLVDARIAQGWTQRSLAERLGMKEQQVQRYESEKYRTANLSRIAEIAEALQLDLFAFFETRDQSLRDQVAPNLKWMGDFDPAKLPVKEMKKRGWLSQIKVPSGITDLSDQDLAAAFISKSITAGPIASLHSQHVRAGSVQDPYALLAWKAQVLGKAKAVSEGDRFRGGTIDLELVKTLPQLSADPKGPLRAVQVLLEHGIIVVLEKHLQGTHLDGAAMLLNAETPVIGLTLRHDRLDNFWFVLAHEIAHIALHRERGLVESFYDDEESNAPNQLELEADEFAKRAFVADEIWKRSFVRFTTDKKQIQSFASDRGIGTAVVAGRIRRERKDYAIFSDLVGSGAVRKLFSESGLWES